MHSGSTENKWLKYDAQARSQKLNNEEAIPSAYPPLPILFRSPPLSPPFLRSP